MANKKISELDQTLNLSDQADFPLSQDNGGEPTTFRAKLTQIATKIAEAITFSNLKTGNKQLVSAVNQTISNLADDFNTTAGSTYAKDDCVLYNGVLYQCINNSGTTSGSFIDADWTAIKAVDVGSGGGGGGGAGGHTIVDDAGTSLTQRTNLQFKGAYSEDNSTDDTTEVNVVREMTKAEFDLLSADEKTGFINITDVTGGNDDRFQPVIYSTEEREIGVWTDGKPLYEKTYHNSAITIASNTELTIDDFSGKFPVSCCGVMRDTTDGRAYYPNWTYNASGQANIYYKKVDNGNLVLRSESDSWGNTWEVFTVVRYTKDSDTAGSGQWTPQGVPAHHYSTDEQVVGTWIDGSTLYEKTYTSSTYYHTTEVAILDLSSLAYDKVISLQVDSEITISGQGTMCFSPTSENAYINSDKIVYAKQSLAAQQSGRTMMSYITVRYTKSST